MKTLTVELFRARDAEECYAIRLPGEKQWRATKGVRCDFEPVWSVEFKGDGPDGNSVPWDAVLERLRGENRGLGADCCAE